MLRLVPNAHLRAADEVGRRDTKEMVASSNPGRE
jgi:hypothetical protein